MMGGGDGRGRDGEGARGVGLLLCSGDTWLCRHFVGPLSGVKLADPERQGLKGVSASLSWASWIELALFLVVF